MFSQMETSQVLLVIGYRFGDMEIKDVVQKGLANEGETTVVVVDPSATLEGLAELFPSIDRERFRVIPHKFCEEGTIEKIGAEGTLRNEEVLSSLLCLTFNVDGE